MRADERTRTADLISLRVIGHVLQGLAQECKSRISKPFALLWLALCCTILRSRWYQSGIKRDLRDARCRSTYSSHGWPDRLSDEGSIALFHRREDIVARLAPYLRVEDLDLYGAGVAGIVDRRADAPELDHPVPHHPPF